MPRVTKTAWFGPKKYLGWGWTITSWQGAVVTAVFAVVIIAAFTLFHGVLRFAVPAAAFVAFLVVALLTGDPPGGPGMGR